MAQQTPAEMTDPGRDDEAQGHARAREITLGAVVFGVLFGVLLNVAITCTGLALGVTIGGSAIAALAGLGVLRGVLRRGSILQTNIAQTVATAISAPAAGVVLTVPVLMLLGFELSIGGRSFWLITLACVAGAFLGTGLIIPLRKQMIDHERLCFPGATAVALILRAPGAGGGTALVLAGGIVVGSVVSLPAALPLFRSEASVVELDELLARERITPADRQRTLAIKTWINAQEVPEPVMARGRLLDQLAKARAALSDHAEQIRQAAAVEGPEGLSPELSAELDRRRQAVTDIQADLAAHPVEDLYRDALVLAAYRAASGEIDWHALRARRLGWATKPLFGYADFDKRVAGPADPNTPLSRRIDRDGNGRPDRWLTDRWIDLGLVLHLPEEIHLLLALAPLALGAGFIAGRLGLVVLGGSLLATVVLAPLAYQSGWLPDTVTAATAARDVREAIHRPLGIGLLAGGGLVGAIMAAPSLGTAVRTLAGPRRRGARREELSLTPIILVVLSAAAFLFLAVKLLDEAPINARCPVTQMQVDRHSPTVAQNGYQIGFATNEAVSAWTSTFTAEERSAFLHSLGARPGWLESLSPAVRAAILAVLAAAWIWLAGVIVVRCVGMTEMAPVPGLALLTILMALLLAGAGAVMGAVMLAAAVSVALRGAADMMSDLKTGSLLGAQPRRQQLMQLLVVWIGPVVCMLTLLLAARSDLLPSAALPGETSSLAGAPEAQAISAMIQSVQAEQAPVALYGCGALVGALLAATSAVPGLGVLVGLSMIVESRFVVTFGLGCVLWVVVSWIAGLILGPARGRAWARHWGVPFAAGLILGEVILSLVVHGLLLVMDGVS